MKNSNHNIGNRTRDLAACSAVSQPSAPPRALNMYYIRYIYRIDVANFFTTGESLKVYIFVTLHTVGLLADSYFSKHTRHIFVNLMFIGPCIIAIGEE